MLAGWSKPAKIAFGVYMGLLFILAIFQFMHVKKKGEREFKDFYSTTIAGTISCTPSGSTAGTYFSWMMNGTIFTLTLLILITRKSLTI